MTNSPTAIICHALDNLLNGMIVYDPPILPSGSLVYGTVATHTCDSGHYLVGRSMRTCTGDDNSAVDYFDEEEPFCQGVCVCVCVCLRVCVHACVCMYTLSPLVACTASTCSHTSTIIHPTLASLETSLQSLSYTQTDPNHHNTMSHTTQKSHAHNWRH